MIELDGSHGEGGGAILRQALALSMLTGKEFSIKNIRKSRPNPGLAPQHLSCVNAAKELCNAEVRGHYIGSEELFFKPEAIKGGHHKIDIGTAGSITLLLQSLLLPSIFSGKRISFQIIGGTDVKWSQPFDYFKFVFLPQMNRYADIEANLFARGYYPKGGGEVKVAITGRYTYHSANSDDVNSNDTNLDNVHSNDANAIPSILLIQQRKLLQIRGVSHASLDLEPSKVAERQGESARLNLEKLGVPVRIENQYSRSLSTGSGLTLWAVYGEDEIDLKNPVVLGADSLGDKIKKSEVVGREAADKLLKLVNSGAAADSYLADQLIPFIALAGGVILTSEITEHVKSNIHVAEQFLDVKFVIKDNMISCEKIINQE